MMNDFPGVLCAIAHGGNTNYIKKEDESKSPILLAAEAVSQKRDHVVSGNVCNYYFPVE